ncbi:MAG: hypothetical protein IT348_09975 [Candidatus Eisenbacteria bacterium]|nr:hypothetical protein [Candidatus Eisenbacteria bacterium]
MIRRLEVTNTEVASMNGLITITFVCLATFQPPWWNNPSTPGWGANRSTTGGLWIPQGPESVDQFEALATLPLLHTPDRIEVVLRAEWESTLERDVWPDRAELRARSGVSGTPLPPSPFTLIGVEDLPLGGVAWWRAETPIGVTGDQSWWFWAFEAGEQIRYDVQVQRRAVPEPAMGLWLALAGVLLLLRFDSRSRHAVGATRSTKERSINPRELRADRDEDWHPRLHRNCGPACFCRRELPTRTEPWWAWLLMILVGAAVVFGFSIIPVVVDCLLRG